MGDDLEGAFRQQQLLDSILEASGRGSRMPTYGEMAAQLEMPKSGVCEVVKNS